VPAQTDASQPVNSEVAAAEAALAASDWKTAESKLDTWIAAHPTDARALFDAGYVADSQNRLDAAAALYRRAVDADPKSFEATLSLGLLLARQHKAEDARPLLVRATKLDPVPADPAVNPALRARAWRALARIDSDQDPAQASNDLLEALKLTPETADDALLAAEIAKKVGQLDAAETAYRRVLAKDPKSEPANAGLAQLLIQRKQFPEAEAQLHRALEQMPNDPLLSEQLAGVLAVEDKAEALPLLEKLHQAHPEDAATTRMLAEVRSTAGDYAGSDALYLKLLTATPNDAPLLLGHAENLVRQAQYAQAYPVFDKATQADPKSPEAWGGLAFAASRTSQPNMTIHALTMRSQLAPETATTYFLWATAYDTLHQNAQAAAYYHHFLDASAGKFQNEEWQARQRLLVVEKRR
jgi:tetratricopeptide (TPR) repeat protein